MSSTDGVSGRDRVSDHQVVSNGDVRGDFPSHRRPSRRVIVTSGANGGRVVIIRTAKDRRDAVTERVVVRFEGDGSGAAELSWGQQEIWSAIQEKGNSLPFCGVRALSPGQTVADVAAGPRFIMSRHQSLRTRLRLDPD